MKTVYAHHVHPSVAHNHLVQVCLFAPQSSPIIGTLFHLRAPVSSSNAMIVTCLETHVMEPCLSGRRARIAWPHMEFLVPCAFFFVKAHVSSLQSKTHVAKYLCTCSARTEASQKSQDPAFR